MPIPDRAIRIFAAAIFLPAWLTACAMPPLPSFLASAEGEVRGRLEQPANGASVIQMHAMSSRRLIRKRVPVEPIIIRDGRMRPQIAVVRPKGKVRVENHDEIFHEIFSSGRENRFSVRLASGEHSRSIVFRAPGLVRAYCRLHPEETFAILVTAAEHLVYLEGGSAFQIPSVPAGEYRIEATGLDGASDRKPLHVLPGETVELTLRLKQAEGS